MLGIDTNVLVRFLVRDEERQFARAQRLLRREAERGEPVFVSHLVLLETEWVLRSRYGLSKAQILGVFSGLLESTELQIEGGAIGLAGTVRLERLCGAMLRSTFPNILPTRGFAPKRTVLLEG
jgi:predicted nucleic-acid-binding protein